MTFHYWYWKNLLPYERDDQWVGFCQKRRYWIKNKTTDIINTQNLHKYLLTDVIDENKINSFICDSIKVSGVKTTKVNKKRMAKYFKRTKHTF